MTPVEIRDALRKIAAEAGPRAYASISIQFDEFQRRDTVNACFYPDGITRSAHAIDASGQDFAEALKALRDAWDAAKDLADKNTIRKMALAIIEITGDQGECSDTALRGAGFRQQQIDRIGASACAEATRLAAGGPFAIIPTIGANALRAA